MNKENPVQGEVIPFILRQKVMFKHCDLAGIVFYPRYFEMINDCVEEFFEIALNYSYQKLHLIGGIPTARIDTVFKAPSRIGDLLEIELRVKRLGGASADLEFTARCGDEVRFSASSTIVFVNKSGKPESWPQVMRTPLDARLEKGT